MTNSNRNLKYSFRPLLGIGIMPLSLISGTLSAGFWIVVNLLAALSIGTFGTTLIGAAGKTPVTFAESMALAVLLPGFLWFLCLRARWKIKMPLPIGPGDVRRFPVGLTDLYDETGKCAGYVWNCSRTKIHRYEGPGNIPYLDPKSLLARYHKEKGLFYSLLLAAPIQSVFLCALTLSYIWNGQLKLTVEAVEVHPDFITAGLIAIGTTALPYVIATAISARRIWWRRAAHEDYAPLITWTAIFVVACSGFFLMNETVPRESSARISRFR